MSQKSLAYGLKTLVVIAVIACVAVFLAIEGIQGNSNVPQNAGPAFAAGVFPLVVVVARQSWRLFSAIGRGHVFTHANAVLLRSMGRGSLASAVVWLVDLMLYVAIVRPIEFVVVASLSVALVFSISLAVVSTALAILTERAADIKDENDLVV